MTPCPPLSLPLHCPTYRSLALSPLYPKEFCCVAPTTGYLTSHLTLTLPHLYSPTLTDLSIVMK